MPHCPDVSVIVPMVHSRGFEMECIRSWTHAQNFPRERYQIVLATNGDRPALAAQARDLLLPNDVLVEQRGAGMHGLYNAGARAATGRYLLFTEFHCLGTPTCLSHLWQWFQDTKSIGGCLHVEHRNPTSAAVMEQRVFEEQFAEWSQPGHWHKVQARGFAIDRETFLAEGLFDASLGLFADDELAARLHSRGYRLGFAVDASVVHVNTAGFGELEEHTADYVAGECHFRSGEDAAALESYFGLPEEWTRIQTDHPTTRRNVRRALRKTIGRAILRKGRPDTATAGVALTELLRRLPATLLGAHRWVLSARLAVTCAKLRYSLSRFSPEGRLQAYKDVWERIGRFHRSRCAMQQLGTERSDLPGEGTLTADRMPLNTWSGLHGLAFSNDRPFRWTEPVAVLRFAIPSERTWKITLDTGGLRGRGDECLIAAFWNGKRVSDEKIDRTGDSFAVSVVASDSPEELQELILVAKPLKPWKHGSTDRRRLGIPLFSVSCESVAEAQLRPQLLSA